jgi:hypothetical protein
LASCDECSLADVFNSVFKPRAKPFVLRIACFYIGVAQICTLANDRHCKSQLISAVAQVVPFHFVAARDLHTVDVLGWTPESAIAELRVIQWQTFLEQLNAWTNAFIELAATKGSAVFEVQVRVQSPPGNDDFHIRFLFQLIGGSNITFNNI